MLLRTFCLLLAACPAFASLIGNGNWTPAHSLATLPDRFRWIFS